MNNEIKKQMNNETKKEECRVLSMRTGLEINTTVELEFDYSMYEPEMRELNERTASKR